LVRSSSWVRQSLRRWCSTSSASHSCKIAAPVSLRTRWARDSIRGRGIGAASFSAPDRSRCPNTTSISSEAGEGLELDAPPASPPVSGGGADPQLGPPSPLRRRPMLAPPTSDPRLEHGKLLALSWQQPGADHRHNSQQTPTTESQTRRWAWYSSEEVWPWEQRGKKPWKTDDGLRPVSMTIKLK
jgi:hypothetical protein